MTKLIFDIIPPHRRAQAKKFWQENSGQIKLGTVLLFVLSFIAVGFFSFSSIFIKPNSAQAAVGYVGASNLIATNGGAPGAITPHASTATGDLLVFYHYGRATGGNETVTLSGFTDVFDTVTANQGHVAVKYRFKQAGDTTFTATVGNYTSGNSGETILEWIETYNNVDSSTPVLSFTASLSTWASSLNIGSIGAPSAATVGDGDMVVVFGGRFENVTAQTTLTGDSLTWAQGTLNNTNLGSDAGAVTQNGLNSTGTNQTATAKTISTTGTANAGAGRMFIINAAPPPNTIAISVSGTQATSVTAGTTANFADGKFILTRTFGPSTNITAIGISETDATVSASSFLSNATLKYDLDITSPYDCAGETYAGTDSTFQSGVSFVSEKASFTNAGVAITTTQTFCGYLIYDISANAPGGDTLEFQITANGDVTDSGTSTISGAPAAVTGTTTIIATTDGSIQYSSNHTTILATGGSVTSGSTVYLDANVSSGTTTETFTPKVEVRDTATAFTGTATTTGTPVIYDSNRPEQRRSTDMVYDSANAQLVLFGGYGGDVTLANMNDVWVLSLATNVRPQWKQLSPSGTAPTARRGLQLIYDSVDTAGGSVDNGRVIVYGGTTGTIDNTGVYALTMTPGSEAWSTLTTSGTAPAFALQHNAVYDPVRDQMLVFGGRDAGNNLGGVVYKLEMNGGTEAWAVAHDGTGTAPGAREVAGMTYDTTNNYVWLHSGCIGATVAACATSMDTWRLKNLDTTPIWENASPASCPPNTSGGIAAMGMGFDSVNNQAVIFAGISATYTSYVYTFNLPASGTVTCTDHSPPSAELPYTRAYGSTKGVFDPNRNAMFFGWGYNGTTYNYELEVFDTLAASGIWGIKGADGISYMRKRDQVATAYDSVGAVAYGFGGTGRSGFTTNRQLTETWRFQPANGAERWEDAGTDFGPYLREGGVFVWDTVDTAGGANDGGRGIYCGGLSIIQRVIDCWMLTPPASAGGRASWSRIGPGGTAPTGRWGMAMIYDSTNDRMLFWGGEENGATYSNQVWELSLNGTFTWTNRTPGTGGPAGGRKFAQAVFDSNSARMIIYGGSDGTTWTNAVWSLSVGTPGSEAWTSLSPAGCDATCTRDRHLAIYDPTNDRMISFGGYDGTTHYNDVWQLTLGVTPAWSKFTPAATPPTARRSSKGFYDPVNTRFVIVMGRDGTDFFDDTWEFDTTSGSDNWKNINPRKTVPITVAVAPAAGDYHWQIWATGSVTGDSAKATYGGNSDVPIAGIDFTVASASMSVSGTVCTNEACSTNVGSSVTVVLKKNGTDSCSGACTATTNASGGYTISGITGAGQNDIFTIYIGGTAATDDNATYNAVTVTKINAAGNLTGIDLVTSRIILRHETGITSLANTDLAGWDKDNDADIKFTSNAGAFVSDNTEELHVWTGKSWIPAGTVTTSATATQSGTGGDLHIDTSAVLNVAANALSVGGDYNNAGTFTKLAGQTTTFTATGASFTIAPGSSNFEHIIFNGVSGGWSFTAITTIDGDLTVTNGTLSGTSSITVSGGDVTGAGDINLTAGIFTLAGTGTIGSNTAWDFNDMVFNGTTTRTATTTGAIVAAGSVTGSGSLDLSATTNTFEQRVSASKNFGTSSGTNNWTFNNLTFSNSHASAAITISPPVNASAGSIIVSGTLQIGKATDAVGANTTFDNETANDRILDIDGSIDITSKGVLQASSTALFTVAGNWTRNGTFTPGLGTVTFNCLSASCPTSLIGQSTTFYSVSFVNTPAGAAKAVNFADASTLTTSAGGVLTITGTAGNLITLNSSTGGEAAGPNWNITHNATATESVNFVTVKNSTCAASSNIDTSNSSGVDADICWIFGNSILTQRAYIFEDDDGTNVNNSNSQIAYNTARTGVRKGERLNIRVQIDNTGPAPASAQTYDLQVCNFTDTACDIPAEWVIVSNASGDIRAGQGLAGGSGDDLSVSGADRVANTTASGSDCVQAGPTFDAVANTSEWYENTGVSNSIIITNNKCIEMSYAVHTANSTLNKEYRFRIVKTSGATVLDGYSQYPALTITSAEDQRYYKNTAGTIANSDAQNSNTTYYFDNKGYATSIATDDSSFDPITSSANVPVFAFVKKFTSTTEYPDIRAIIQSTVAASTRNILLQVYCFGGVNCTGGVNTWETVTTNSTLAADTDGELNSSAWSPVSATKSDYYETGGSCGAACWTYFRLYQTSGAQTLKVDWVGQPLYRSSTQIISQTFDTNAVNGAGYHSIIWKGTKPAGTNVKIQLANSNCANGGTGGGCTGAWGATGSDYFADNGTTCAITNYYTAAANVSQRLNKCSTQFNNKRYFRYKVILEASLTRDLIPTVEDVSVNWTP